MQERLIGWEKYQGIISPVINKSYIYLFPMIGLANQVKRDYFTNLEGVFLLNEDFNIKDKIYILFKKDYTVKFSLFTQEMMNMIYYSFSYEPDSQHVIYVFEIPYEYKREYQKFLDSKYSEFSENYKKSVIAFHSFKQGAQGDSIINVMYKKEAAYRAREKTLNEGLPEGSWIKIPRDQEIGTLWNENQETMYLETYSKDMKIIFEDKTNKIS